VGEEKTRKDSSTAKVYSQNPRKRSVSVGVHTKGGRGGIDQERYRMELN